MMRMALLRTDYHQSPVPFFYTVVRLSSTDSLVIHDPFKIISGAEVEEYRAGVAQSDAFGFFLNRCKQELNIWLNG